MSKQIGKPIGKPIGKSVGVGAVSGIPAIITDGNSVGWYIADDLTTITKDGADRVSDWADKLGSGNDLVQLTGAAQPLWSSTGILFDGITEFMNVLFAYTQPGTVYVVIQQPTWVNNDFIYDGGSDFCGLAQFGIANELTVFNGTTGVKDDYPLNTFGIVRCVHNGVNSSIQINADAINEGDAGANDFGGITLGSRNGGASAFANVEFKEAIFRKIADTSGDRDDIKNYLASKYGI